MAVTPETVTVSLIGEPPSGATGRLLQALERALERNGAVHGESEEANFVLNAIDRDAPKPFRRKSRGTFVAAVHERDSMPDQIEESLKLEYPMLVRALANIVLCYVPGQGVWFTTMERGHYLVPEDGDLDALASQVVDRLMPLATSRLVIDNEWRTDLEEELWEGDEISMEIKRAGELLGKLDLLPSPFPIEELLSERELRHVKRLYSIGGLSYGNLSMRKDETRSGMTASDVDKTKLETAGRDILVVSGYEPGEAKMILSVPPGIESRRVSV